MNFHINVITQKLWRKRRGITIALIVLVAVWGYLRLHEWSANLNLEMLDVMGIRNTLHGYAKIHNGVLPDSWDTLIDNGILRRSDENPFTLSCEEDFGRYTIKDIRKFTVAFGTRPEMITISEPYVLDAEGKRILLIAPSGESLLDEASFRSHSLVLAKFMKKCAASKSKNSPTSSSTEK